MTFKLNSNLYIFYFHNPLYDSKFIFLFNLFVLKEILVYFKYQILLYPFMF